MCGYDGNNIALHRRRVPSQVILLVSVEHVVLSVRRSNEPILLDDELDGGVPKRSKTVKRQTR